MKVLAGDIGGTHCRLMLAQQQSAGLQVVAEQSYASATYPDLLPVIETFLAEHAGAKRPDAACFAVAGPVRHGQARITNLPWQLDEDRLAEQLQIPHLSLINDFEAIGHGLDELEETDLCVLQRGDAEVGARRALIGAGTGLGQALLIYRHGAYRPYPTEGGHVAFAPQDELQIRLLEHLLEQQDYVSYETLLSGSGLIRIYQFLLDTGRHDDQHLLDQNGDKAALISKAALADEDPAASAALDCFIRIYGAQAGNFALDCLATAGVYIAGGIATKVVPALQKGGFMQAFLHKGKMATLMQQIPVSLILNDNVGLRGAAKYASRLLPG